MGRGVLDLARAAAEAEPADGLEALPALRAELDRLEREHVKRALDAGWSWSRIAESLGISKQAAHKRHAAHVNGTAPTQPESERSKMVVAGAARRSVQLAKSEARELGCDLVGTDHLLLGVLRLGDGDAAGPLASLGVSARALRDLLRSTQQTTWLEDCADGRLESPPPSEPLPVSPRARRALEQSLREARSLGSGRLEARHIALAVLRDPEGAAMRALRELGVKAEDVERALGAQPSSPVSSS